MKKYVLMSSVSLLLFSSLSLALSPLPFQPLEGANQNHQVALDVPGKLIWNLLPAQHNSYAEAEMMCTLALAKSGRLKDYNQGLEKWRLPTKKEMQAVSKHGFREFFKSNVFWVSDTTEKNFFGYDKVHDQFLTLKREEKVMDIICVTEKN